MEHENGAKFSARPHNRKELFMFGQMGIVIITVLAIVMLHFNFPALGRARSNKAGQAGLMSGAELLFNDGRAAYWNKSYRDAVRMLKHAALIRPERAITHYYLGLSHSALGNFGEAEKAYREALRRDPKNNIAWSELGDLYRKLNRWEDAVEAYQHALQIKPDFVTAHSGLEAAYACLAIEKAA
jgi:tetratricopeptide (TPR) repeat protein